MLWGVADAGTQSLIAEAHHAAVAQVVALLEREVAVTRAGFNADRLLDGSHATFAQVEELAMGHYRWRHHVADDEEGLGFESLQARKSEPTRSAAYAGVGPVLSEDTERAVPGSCVLTWACHT